MKNLLNLFLVTCVCLTISAFSQIKSDVKILLSEAANYLQTGGFTEAEKVLLQAKKLNPNNADVHNLLGIIYDQKSDFAKAESEYRTAIRLNPKAVSPLANLGILLAKTNRPKDAIQTFEIVLKLNPNHPQTIINLGFLYSSVGNFPFAIEFLNMANLIQPNSYDILFKLGTALYQTKKLDEAKQIFTQISSTAEPLYYLGLIAFDQNQAEIALQYFENSLALKPDFADANFMLGEIMAQQKRYAEAVQFYQKAIAQDKTKDVYFVRLGGTYLVGNNFAKALQYFKEASQLFPKIAEIRYFLAVTLRTQGSYDLAFIEAKKALSLKETADSNAIIGSMLVDRNEIIDAEKYLRKAILLNPNHFNSHHDLGRLLVKAQKFAEALPFLQKAVALLPDNPDVHYQLFLTYSRLKRKDEAEKELKIFKQLSEKK